MTDLPPSPGTGLQRVANPVPPGPSAGSQVPMATAVVCLAWTGLATSAAAVLLQGRPQLRPELLDVGCGLPVVAGD